MNWNIFTKKKKRNLNTTTIKTKMYEPEEKELDYKFRIRELLNKSPKIFLVECVPINQSIDLNFKIPKKVTGWKSYDSYDRPKLRAEISNYIYSCGVLGIGSPSPNFVLCWQCYVDTEKQATEMKKRFLKNISYREIIMREI